METREKMVRSPEKRIGISSKYFNIFLAGSIENGAAEDWRTEFYDKFLSICPIYKGVMFNPRREVWDSTLKRDISEPETYSQITWELDYLKRAELIVMYFSPGTISPITLLELGLYANSGKLIVVCPDGYFRKADVDIVCKENNIPMFPSIDIMIRETVRRYDTFNDALLRA